MDTSRDNRADDPTQPDVRMTYFVRGTVQGVGFRWWTRSRALELGLVGHARNLSDGRVEVVVQGPATAVEEMGALLSASPVPHRRPGLVETCTGVPGEVRAGLTGFEER
ncbi:acylphosphatase [Arsenicicoccus piscis]|uniref:acylphosphatase n=1 Tax=Arsenicicoccus piscis TaxID=673954 RepID=A0ABQ6HMC8_9MICO|nr:acylphosphatase [Arsenicicoccus piscis]MCH8626846.1 acylphosphatase [Arsenicicoccus piscis]GMA19248.1 acylphosphatase [Arsenicicoccus piscis]